jgi:cyclic pyranopterin phosphate synthase
MPEEGVPLLPHEQILRYEEIAEIVREAAKVGFSKVRLTGGEPLVRKGIVDLVKMLSAIDGVETLAMTTNGTLLSGYAESLAAAGLQRVNISLDTLDAGRYADITRGGELGDVLRGIEAARNAGLGIKLNMVVQPDTSAAEISALRAFAEANGASLQTIAQYSLAETKVDGSGCDRPPDCASCNRLRLLANGMLRSCLHSDIDTPVDFGDIAGSIRRAVAAKPFHGGVSSTLSLREIGG